MVGQQLELVVTFEFRSRPMDGILNLDIPAPTLATQLYLQEIITESDLDFLAGSVFGSE
jgi:hypothetical protein